MKIEIRILPGIIAALCAFPALGQQIFLHFETLADGVTASPASGTEVGEEYAAFCMNLRNPIEDDDSRGPIFERTSTGNTIVLDNSANWDVYPLPHVHGIAADFLVPISAVSADVIVPFNQTLTMTAYDATGGVLGAVTSVPSTSCCDNPIDTLTLFDVGDISTVRWVTSSPTAVPAIDNLAFTATAPCGDTAQVVTMTMEIDIKPDGTPNVINPRSSGVFPVAVLGSAQFDATQVDSTSVRMGPDEAAPVRDGSVEDVNHDGFADLVLHFQTHETGLTCDDVELEMSGATFAGVPLTGSDSVQVAGCR